MKAADRQFIGVANDKGGVGKSLTAALIAEHLGSTPPTTVVEIEQRSNFTQALYRRPETIDLHTMALIVHDEASNRDRPSLSPLDSLWDFIPKTPQDSRRLIVDFGASAFQSFFMWGRDHRGLQPFRGAEFKFTFFVPVQASDIECAQFFNLTAPTLMKLGNVVLVRNLREGTDFSMLDQKLVEQVPSIALLHRGRPLVTELQQPNQRLTFRQLAAHEGASRRARLDAEDCAEHFETQFEQIRPKLGI